MENGMDGSNGASPAESATSPAATGNTKAAYVELASLRHAVTGVLGCVIAGVDGLMLLTDLNNGADPHDLAALAAATFGVGRQTGVALRQGAFRESTIHSQRGYFAVYAINDRALLAVLGGEGMNIARLHLEARAVTSRLNTMLDAHFVSQDRL
jgi:predicted regulator of Ras-like GTPase activity (Roadblock/LC7/MglB family)